MTPPRLMPASSAATAPAKKDAATLQEVVVTGIRASLEKSLDIKKDASVVLDSINSTELGRFPDADVADSLEHLPGITIDRTTGGEGSSDHRARPRRRVQHHHAQQPHSRQRRRQPRSGLRRAALGGDHRRRRAQVTAGLGARGQHRRHGEPAHRQPLRQSRASRRCACRGQLQRHVAPERQQFSLFVSNTNDDQTLGFVLGGVHSDTNIRTDSLNAYNQNIYGPTDLPLRRPETPGRCRSPPPPAASPSARSSMTRSATRSPAAWSGIPSETFKLVGRWPVDPSERPADRLQRVLLFRRPTRTAPRGRTTRWCKNGVMTAVTVNQFQPEMVNNTINRKVDTSVFGLNAQLEAAPTSLTFGLDAVPLDGQPARGRRRTPS